MKTDDYYYDLPPSLIAQEPLSSRGSSRLLFLRRNTGVIAHHRFHSLINLVKPGDRFLINDTKVIPARIYCDKETGARVELLFTQRINDYQWKAMVKPARRLKEGQCVSLHSHKDIQFKIEKILSDGTRIITLCSKNSHSIESLLNAYGTMPLPPYIKRQAQSADHTSYQTVYANKVGAIAAPTAGLHFTDELIQKLRSKQVDFSTLTLHVGIGTFKPVKEEDPQNHTIHEEYFELPLKTVQEIHETKRNGGRVIAVGTTSVRVLEHCAISKNTLQEAYGTTRLMILPGYRFQIIDGLITNFHLPRSTLLMLVSAFAERTNILNAYHEAIENQYRFYSYGDAMFIL